jgi:Glucosidase II beta subunit-like
MGVAARRTLLASALLLAVSFCDAKERRIRGLSPAQREAQPAKGFECHGGVKVPFARVNDGFCDCPGAALQKSTLESDGPHGFPVTDEPGTGACGGFSGFWCPNQATDNAVPARGSFVPASAVNDGLCDCCDGADEWDESRPGFSVCKNTCAEEGREYRAELVAELERQKEGLQAAQRVREESQRKKGEVAEELAKNKQERDTLAAPKAEAEGEEEEEGEGDKKNTGAGPRYWELERGLGANADAAPLSPPKSRVRAPATIPRLRVPRNVVFAVTALAWTVVAALTFLLFWWRGRSFSRNAVLPMRRPADFARGALHAVRPTGPGVGVRGRPGFQSADLGF